MLTQMEANLLKDPLFAHRAQVRKLSAYRAKSRDPEMQAALGQEQQVLERDDQAMLGYLRGQGATIPQ